MAERLPDHPLQSEGRPDPEELLRRYRLRDSDLETPSSAIAGSTAQPFLDTGRPLLQKRGRLRVYLKDIGCCLSHPILLLINTEEIDMAHIFQFPEWLYHTPCHSCGMTSLVRRSHHQMVLVSTQSPNDQGGKLSIIPSLSVHRCPCGKGDACRYPECPLGDPLKTKAKDF